MVLLSQAQGDRQILAKQLGISEHQLSYVTHSNSGDDVCYKGELKKTRKYYIGGRFICGRMRGISRRG